MLFLSAKNVFSEQAIIIKITIKNQKILKWIMINLNKKIHMLGAFDMNMDSLIDLLYIDSNNNVSNIILIYLIFISFTV